MEKIETVRGISIDPNEKYRMYAVLASDPADYFISLIHMGIEGKVEGIENGNLIITEGRDYDVDELVALGYDKVKKYNFARREIPLRSIRVFEKGLYGAG